MSLQVNAATASGPTVLRTDLANLVETRLHASPYLPLRKLTCYYHEGVLTVRGRVPTFYLKQMAQTVAMNQAGVEEVNNQVSVLPPGGGPRHASTLRRSR